VACIKPVKTVFHAMKNSNTLKKVFNQMTGFVALLIHGALYFSVDLAGNDGLPAVRLSTLDNLV
jgi:hypothetical protein